MSEEQPRRRGNPNWVKGGPSPNPAGRPASHWAFIKNIRDKYSERAKELMVQAMENLEPWAIQAVLQYAWGKPAEKVLKIEDIPTEELVAELEHRFALQTGAGAEGSAPTEQ